MNRKVIKFIAIALLIFTVIATLSTKVLATDNTDYTNLNQFNNQSEDSTTSSVFQKFIATVINLVQIVGMAVAIIMLIVVAIKYISAAPSEKAELKKVATIYIVGAIVLFAAAGLLQLVKNFAVANINSNVSSDPDANNGSGVVEMVEDTTIYLG